jgi:Peptidase family M28
MSKLRFGLFALVCTGLLVVAAALAFDTKPASGGGHSQPVSKDVRHMLRDVSSSNIEATIQKLVSFGTRHTLSSQTARNRGIPARLAARVGGPHVRRQRTPRLARHRRLNGTSDAPGADDDGSGVAAVLELARVMSQHQFDAAIVFAVCSGAEQGTFGSVNFATRLKAAGTQQGLPARAPGRGRGERRPVRRPAAVRRLQVHRERGTKDNYLFGVRAVDTAGNRSVVTFPAPK